MTLKGEMYKTNPVTIIFFPKIVVVITSNKYSISNPFVLPLSNYMIDSTYNAVLWEIINGME